MEKSEKQSKKNMVPPSFKSPFLPENPKVVGVQEGYDLWSEIYDGEVNALIQLEQLHLFPQLKKRNFQTVFDCGCGTGRLAMWLHQQFPQAAVTGADFSEGMLSKARAKDPSGRVNWQNADLNKEFPFAAGQFELIVSSLVIEHITALDMFFAGIRKVAAEGAEIFVSGLHPAMHLLGITARFKSQDNTTHILPESRCHSISDIYNAAVEAGLKVTRMEECCVDELLISHCPKAERYAGMPLLLLMKMTTG